MSCFRVVFDVLDFMDMIIGFISYVGIQMRVLDLSRHMFSPFSWRVVAGISQILEFSYTLHERVCVPIWS
jgi:hypothetical protein